MLKKFLINVILHFYKNTLLKKKNVQGIGTGVKITDGKFTNIRGIIVGVTKKQKSLKAKDLIPKSIAGVPVDVIEVGNLEEMWRKKHRPMKLGASACWEGLTACSFGLPLYEGEKKYVMMNQHCVNPTESKPGEDLVNPSPIDGKPEKIGTITDMFFPVSSKREDNIDVSLCELDVDVTHEDVEGVGYIPKTRPLTENDILKDIWGGGRTLETRRKGIIISVDFEATVWGRENGVKVIRKFPNSVLALNSDGENPIVLGGDSSSIRFVDGMPLLQTFAGSEIAAVFNQTYKSIEWIESTYSKSLSLEPEYKRRTYIAAGKKWYIDTPLGLTETTTRLNLRSEPYVSSDTFIKTLDKGTQIEVLDNIGEKNGYHWIEVEV